MDTNRFNYVLQQADNSLILGQRLAEWCGHGPILEQDIAMTNISLDLIDLQIPASQTFLTLISSNIHACDSSKGSEVDASSQVVVMVFPLQPISR